ncbi:MAG: TraR/DksA family transcriptional regulator [Thiotrichales bacterium]
MSEILSPREIEELQGLLTHRRAALLEEIKEELERLDQEQYRQLAGEVHDMEDLALAHRLTEMNHSEINRHRHQVDEVNAAFRRIAEGTIGQCVECGKPIGFPRLKVNPTANRCIRCQDVFEKTHRGLGYASP